MHNFFYFILVIFLHFITNTRELVLMYLQCPIKPCGGQYAMETHGPLANYLLIQCIVWVHPQELMLYRVSNVEFLFL